MSTYVEYVTYKVDAVDERFLELRRKAILAFKENHPKLLAVPVFSHDSQGKCTEIWIYQSEQDAQIANAEGGSIPEFAAYAELLHDLNIVAEEMPAASADPLTTGTPNS